MTDTYTHAARDLDHHEARRRDAGLPALTPQQRIAWLNRRAVELGHDPRRGIIGGDGYYYPRAGFPE